ncbi:MAG: polyprenyl synthetase family protein [Candidatus Binatia bacterium]
MEIDEYLRRRAAEVDAALAGWARDRRDRVEPRLLEAMEYSLVSPGKRIRPVLVLAAAEAVGADPLPVLPFACAVEMVHAYSLIHDDLPAMDDDDMRRGQPTNHKVFGEAMAILAGDGLLTEAFALMSAGPSAVPSERRVAAAAELAAAAGAEGMVGGQAADILAEGTVADLARVESIHRRKTGALLRASVRIGSLVCGADPPTLDRLSRYGEAIGFAFQVADDVLDETSDSEATGKTAQRDRALGKATVPAVLGVSRARELLGELLERALGAVGGLGTSADPLREIARRIVGRAL